MLFCDFLFLHSVIFCSGLLLMRFYFKVCIYTKLLLLVATETFCVWNDLFHIRTSRQRHLKSRWVISLSLFPSLMLLAVVVGLTQLSFHWLVNSYHVISPVILLQFLKDSPDPVQLVIRIFQSPI